MSSDLSILNTTKIHSEFESLNSELTLAFINKENDIFISNKKIRSEQSINNSVKRYVNNSIYNHNKNKNKLRKDIHGNLIEKGGKHKVSFVDDVKGKYLVEMTFYNAKDNCLKRKNYKDYTIKRYAKDRQNEITEPGCNIF